MCILVVQWRKAFSFFFLSKIQALIHSTSCGRGYIIEFYKCKVELFKIFLIVCRPYIPPQFFINFTLFRMKESRKLQKWIINVNDHLIHFYIFDEIITLSLNHHVTNLFHATLTIIYIRSFLQRISCAVNTN